MEHRFESSLCLNGSKFMTSSSSSDACEVSVLKQTALSQYIVDTAWLLRKPALEDIEHILTLSQIGRFNRLLTFLIDNESTSILERVLDRIETTVDYNELYKLGYGIADTDMKLLQSNLGRAREILCQRLQPSGNSVQHCGNLVQKVCGLYRSSGTDMLSITFSDQVRFPVVMQKSSFDIEE